jgi:hypothetical protein
MAHQDRRVILPPQFDETQRLAEEVLDLWYRPMSRLDWPKRLELLGEIVRLTADKPGLGQLVAAKLVHRLGEEPIRCREQALFYGYAVGQPWPEAAG